MASKSRIDPLLRLWGHYYGEHKPREWDEDRSFGPHPIATAMEYAGGECEVARHRSRDVRRMRGVPTWGYDPVSAHETRSRRVSTSDDIPPFVQRVQNEAVALHRIDTLRGTVLRMEFCTRGPQADKAAQMVRFGMSISLRQYREALAYSLGWMESRLSIVDDSRVLALPFRMGKIGDAG